MRTPRAPRPRRILALGGALLLSAGTLGACATPSSTDASSAGPATRQVTADPDPSTMELVGAGSTTEAGSTTQGGGATRGWPAPRRLRHVLHATWVTGGRTPTTHEAIRGEVTAVSASSITVRARDGVSLTFTMTSSTKVRERHDGTGQDSTIGQVEVGDRALVSGVQAATLTARHVVYGMPKRSSARPNAASVAPSVTRPT